MCRGGSPHVCRGGSPSSWASRMALTSTTTIPLRRAKQASQRFWKLCPGLVRTQGWELSDAQGLEQGPGGLPEASGTSQRNRKGWGKETWAFLLKGTLTKQMDGPEGSGNMGA